MVKLARNSWQVSISKQQSNFTSKISATRNNNLKNLHSPHRLQMQSQMINETVVVYETFDENEKYGLKMMILLLRLS